MGCAPMPKEVGYAALVVAGIVLLLVTLLSLLGLVMHG